jgi:RimJ/RimL family protein N-acetyltransferase
VRFETERLIIRKPVLADAEQIYANYATDPLVTRYMIWSPHQSVDDSRGWIAHCEGVLHRYSIHPTISPAPRDCAMYARVR